MRIYGIHIHMVKEYVEAVCNPRTLLFSIRKGHSPNPWSLELPEAEHLPTGHSVATGVTHSCHIAARILPWHPHHTGISQTEL